MSPSDVKSRSSALAVFVSTFSRRSQFQSNNFIKEKRVIRDTSPLRPWDSDTTSAASKKYAYLSKEYTKRSTCKRENEKFIPFTFKPSNAKERNERAKFNGK